MPLHSTNAMAGKEVTERKPRKGRKRRRRRRRGAERRSTETRRGGDIMIVFSQALRSPLFFCPTLQPRDTM